MFTTIPFNLIIAYKHTVKMAYFTNPFTNQYLLIVIMIICENARITKVSRPIDWNNFENLEDAKSRIFEIENINKLPDIAPIVSGIIGKHWLWAISRCQNIDIIREIINDKRDHL